MCDMLQLVLVGMLTLAGWLAIPGLVWEGMVTDVVSGMATASLGGNGY